MDIDERSVATEGYWKKSTIRISLFFNEFVPISLEAAMIELL